MTIAAVREFVQKESAGGLLIIAAAVLAMLAENSPLKPLYDAWLSTPVGIQFGTFLLNKPLLLWINDGLMAVFFFLIGLEVKREFLQGELSDHSRVILPVIAAVGGMAGPALVYVAFNHGDPAALAGVVLAFFIPLKNKNTGGSPLTRLEHMLHPYVACLILPLFAFANTGISFTGLTPQSLLHPVPLGIAAGLFVGKQIGVFGFTWLAIKLGFGKLPKGASWASLYGVAALCGIGFTMSLFISSLAAEKFGTGMMVNNRLGILCGSALSAILGYLVVACTLGRANHPDVPAPHAGTPD